ncbi:hypothetical protein R6Q59_015785 [Mikania micrantha]
MAKFALVFALTLTAIVAFSAVSAYRTTIITTTIDDTGVNTPWSTGLDNRKGSQEQCRTQIPIQQLNHCQMHLTQWTSLVVNPMQKQQHLQQCCTQLKQVSKECQCDAIQQVFDEARQQAGVTQVRQMLSKAQRLPTECSLEVQECPLVSPRV